MADASALKLRWVFGFNTHVGGVLDLTAGGRQEIYYSAGHTGVIYDYDSRTQRLLQGHTNPITCACVSADKRWLATADSGADSMVVVWNAVTGVPVKTIFNPHADGVATIDMSPDAMYIATLSSASPQQLSIWEWTVQRETPLYSATCTANDLQMCLRFNPSNVKQLVTNGTTRVIFWNWDEGALKFYSPPISSRDFQQPVGAFTQSCFIPDSTQAVTGTVDGDIVLWDQVLLPEKNARPTDKRAVKLTRLFKDASVNQLRTLNRFLVCGTSDGCVRFYDFKFRILAWYEDIHLGPITSLAFTYDKATAKESSARAEELVRVPNFIIGTATGVIALVNSAVFEKLKPEERGGEVLIEGFDAPVAGAVAHPSGPYLAVATTSGMLRLVDYESKTSLSSTRLEKFSPSAVGFDLLGRYIGLGGANGVVKIVSATNMQELQSFSSLKKKITLLTFASDGRYMAVADVDHSVGIFRFERHVGDEGNEVDWRYIGRYRSHHRKVIGLEFSLDPPVLPDGYVPGAASSVAGGSTATKPATENKTSKVGSVASSIVSGGAAVGGGGGGGGGSASGGQVLRLFSLGEDRVLCEYDLANSFAETGVVLKFAVLVEQTALPSALCLLPGRHQDMPNTPLVIISANNEYKLKVLDVSNVSGTNTRQDLLVHTPSLCHRTVLGPTFGAPLDRLMLIPGGGRAGKNYLLYACPEKVVGIMKIPLDGNPHDSMGIIGHSGSVHGVSCSFDGWYAMTVGGGVDNCVNMWELDVSALEASSKLGGEGITPFMNMIEGGAQGERIDEMRDFFYYAQLRSQGEDTTEDRRITGKVSPSSLPDLFRALGCYPTEFEARDLLHEIAVMKGAPGGAPAANSDESDITFDELVKLYVNHRPVMGIDRAEMEAAFAALGAQPVTGLLKTEVLLRELQRYGEPLSEAELSRCIRTLSAFMVGGESGLPAELTAVEFGEKVLGFESAGEIEDKALASGEIDAENVPEEDEEEGEQEEA